MARVAFLLAGQGAQKPGMGRSLYEHSPAARALFDTLEAIRPGTLEMCFSGSAQELSQTANTQPCVFAVDMACAAAAQEAGLVPAFLAGFSLGELAGVALSGMLPVEDAFRLVIRRAELMDECAKAHPGAMLAVLKLDAARVEALARRVRRSATADDEQAGSEPDQLVSGPFVLDEKSRVLYKSGKPIDLTQVEFQIMELFFRNPGTALVREKILEGVWGKGYFGDVKIVDVNIRRLRMKVEDEPSSPQHILTVWGYGYRWNA